MTQPSVPLFTDEKIADSTALIRLDANVDYRVNALKEKYTRR